MDPTHGVGTRGRLSLAVIAVWVAGCLTPTQSPVRSSTLSPSLSALPTAAPSPTLPQPTLLDPDDLPSANLEELDATLICDPEASRIDGNGESLVACYDGLLLGLRALTTAVDGVDRLYLRRPICASSPCPPEELSRVTVTGWTGDAATSVTIDWEDFRVTPPAPDPGARWPTPNSTAAPAVARPEIEGAPKVVQEREPLPFCGNAIEIGVAANQCFLSAVLDGRPAEMLDKFDVTGGTVVYRFDGRGLVCRYAMFPDGWLTDAGGLVLSGPGGWSLDNWVEAEPIS